jgi:hypothetical protein
MDNRKSHPRAMHPIGRAELREQERIRRRWAISRAAIVTIIVCAIAYAVIAREVL